MRTVILGVSAVALCLAVGLGVLQAADPRPVTFAVIRGDGILIPIATRTGREWALTWPVPIKAVDVPIDVDEVPKRWWGKAGPAKTWHAWTIDGATTEVHVERPAWYPAHCQQGIGLKTALTARPPLPPPTLQPYPKLGLAATSRVPFGTVEVLDETTKLWAAIRAAVGTGMDKAEDAMTRTAVQIMQGYAPAHPFKPEERHKVATRLESLYRMPLGDGRMLHYFEGAKRYPQPPIPVYREADVPTAKDGCGLLTFGFGWLVVGPDEKVPVPDVTAYVTPCDYGAMPLMLPLGYVPDPEGPLWFAQHSSWDAETYSVSRIDPATGVPAVLLTTHGGVCPAPGSRW